MKTFRRYEFPVLNYRFMILFFSCLLFLASCTSVYYENPQPAGQENLSKFPKKHYGTYVDAEKGDTVVILAADGISMDMNNNDVKIPLSEKTILRKYKSFYFLSLKQENDNIWAVYIVKPAAKKTLDLYDFSTEETDLEKLGAITEVKKINKEGQETPVIVINPTLAELDKILESGMLKPVQKLKR